MQSFFISINAVLPIVIMAGIGCWLRMKKILAVSTFNEMNSLCFKLFLPSLLFYNVYTSEFSASHARLIIFEAVGITAVFAVLSLLVPVFVKDKKRVGVIVQGIYRGNYILLGVPIATVICGEGNIGPVALAASVVVPLFNFLAVITLSINSDKKVNWKELIVNIVKNPLIGSSLIGLVFVFAGIKLPVFLASTFRDLGRTATPLALIILGGSLAPEKALTNIRALTAVCFFRLIAVPLVMVSIALAFGFRGAELVSVLMTFAAPTAVSSFVMSRQMGADAELAGEIILVTSVVSVFTMFLWIFGLSSAGLI